MDQLHCVFRWPTHGAVKRNRCIAIPHAVPSSRIIQLEGNRFIRIGGTGRIVLNGECLAVDQSQDVTDGDHRTTVEFEKDRPRTIVEHEGLAIADRWCSKFVQIQVNTGVEFVADRDIVFVDDGKRRPIQNICGGGFRAGLRGVDTYNRDPGE